MDGEEWELYSIINSKSILLGGLPLHLDIPFPAAVLEPLQR
jgi:hypothetical protein